MSEAHDKSIAMPNEIFSHLGEWLSNKEIKSVQHQEFIYSYLWLISYFWRYARYSQYKITQQSIKTALGYNPDDKRLNYIIKKGGLLDVKHYTSTIKDYPVSWSFTDPVEGVSFTMLSELDKEFQTLVTKYESETYQIKCPLISLGTEEADGTFWNTDNTHFMSLDVFKACMNESSLQCKGFYLCGLLKYIGDKSAFFNDSIEFECSNDTIRDLTGWSIRRITETTTALMDVGLIHKEQQVKTKGQRNTYRLFF